MGDFGTCRHCGSDEIGETGDCVLMCNECGETDDDGPLTVEQEERQAVKDIQDIEFYETMQRECPECGSDDVVRLGDGTPFCRDCEEEFPG
jgi:ribosomal protein L37AE/L43A